MDFDIEMDDVVMDTAPVPEAYVSDIVVGDEQEPGEIDEELPTQDDDPTSDERALVLSKVHIRGLDTFTPADVGAYLKEHFGGGTYDKIEWIDDTSLNLVFGSESIAHDALVALANVEIADATQLPPLEAIPAKPFSGKPDSTLSVRFAVTGDRKVAGAAQRSRFYLLHPEYDPEERKRRGDTRGKYRDRDSYGRRNERGRGNGRRTGERIDEYDTNSFDVNLYDDDDGARATRKSHSRRGSSARLPDSPESEAEERRFSRQNREKELFPDRRLKGRDSYSRDRSASPMRDDIMADLERDREALGRNREKARVLKDRLSSKEGTAKELFPAKAAGSKELFPSKASSGGGQAQMDRIATPVVLTSGMSRLSLRDLRFWGFHA
ncbi:hypothetical protein DL546_006702 [Coniochaeta pulveracea]|uniref:Uncharacterized protein n=1 Tax=Coniochaeta pulveracea TaxID=177199 RepID=A0A420YDL3_9PEZI|nr:hypothetical protein DL546_006702 [Coniochaeta pulveracea]